MERNPKTGSGWGAVGNPRLGRAVYDEAMARRAGDGPTLEHRDLDVPWPVASLVAVASRTVPYTSSVVHGPARSMVRVDRPAAAAAPAAPEAGRGRVEASGPPARRRVAVPPAWWRDKHARTLASGARQFQKWENPQPSPICADCNRRIELHTSADACADYRRRIPRAS